MIQNRRVDSFIVHDRVECPLPREVDSSGKVLVEFHGHKTRNAPPRGIEMSRSSYNITAHDRVERPEKMIQAARKQLLLRAVLQHVCTRVLTPESSASGKNPYGRSHSDSYIDTCRYCSTM
jgi:hypothetical protein